MKRALAGLSMMIVGALSMGANGGGCSTDYAPGDGSSAQWPTGPVPTPSSTVLPMTCEWLDSNNCWKELVKRADACKASTASKGKLAADRGSCSFPSGAEWDFGGALDTPAPGSTQLPVTDWRIVDGSSDTCMTGKILGVGKTLIDIDGHVAVFESPSLLEYHLTCPDGVTYGNDQPGTCPDFGARYLEHRTPGVLWVCDGSSKECKLSLWGGSDDEETVATCGG